MGRAALQARNAGLEVVFGDTWEGPLLVGMAATPGGWVPVRRRVRAVQDRFPGQARAKQWSALHAGARSAGVVVGNGRSLTLLCRDKLLCQVALGLDPRIRQPPVESEPARFGAVVRQWKGGFAKPRFGALGAGVRHVIPGEAVPATLPGVVDGRDDPTLVQWPVPPPPGQAGCVLRVLAQREVRRSGLSSWHLLPPVLRQSDTDRVVNAARGARVGPARDHLSAVVLDEVRQMVWSTCRVLERRDDAAGMALELGVDIAIDDHLRPWVLEVNTRPRGRLAVLARAHPERFGALHARAMVRPWQTLAAWC